MALTKLGVIGSTCMVFTPSFVESLSTTLFLVGYVSDPRYYEALSRIRLAQTLVMKKMEKTWKQKVIRPTEI